jgi:hypothetical protein
MLRIVFSIVYYQQHLPVRLVSATTKSRWKFYAQVQRLSFHTAKTHKGHQARASLLGFYWWPQTSKVLQLAH